MPLNNQLTLPLMSQRWGLKLSYVDDDTISVGAGSCLLPNGSVFSLDSPINVTFANLDTGTRTLGRDYSVHATPDGIKLHLIPVDNSALGALYPVGYTAQNSRLLGYFHNGPRADGTVGPSRNQAIFQYSVTSNDLLNESYPYRAHPDLPAGVPLPGMVKIGSLAIGIYQASRADATGVSAGVSNYPTSRYGVVPWANISGWNAMAVCRNSGLRLPTWEEWLGCVEFNPGQNNPARMNGNTAYGSASDDSYLAPPGALASALAGLGAGNLSAGLYKYKVTLVNALGETIAGSANAGTTVSNPTTDGQIALSSIPIGGTGTIARKIYRTVANGSTYKLLTTINDNVTTTFVDNVSDANLGANEPGFNTTGSQQGAPDPTCNGRTLTGTGPRTSNNSSSMAGRSWYSPGGIADPVGNIWEWVATFFGGLKTSSPGGSVNWGFEGDLAWNFQGQSYNPETGGYTEGLPAMLIVGGSWSNGANAGVRATNANNSAGNANTNIGFRSVNCVLRVVD